ncbi:MAG: nuclear transport factor 2 family protein [Deltaproteobacteria bacterium]|nr:nuclear transport factor 2 family protein [Deltaproteobacteria bacterium]
MAHPLEGKVREAYAAFGRGDVDGYLRHCTRDFYFNVPGRSAVSGSFRGKEGLDQLFRRVMEISAGTFQEEVQDVLANDQHAIVLARHRFERGGKAKEYLTAHVYEVREGKLGECWEQPRDQVQFDAAWGQLR